MTFEERIDILIEALQANTAAHVKLGEIALATASGKPATGKADSKTEKADPEKEDTSGEDDAAAKKAAAAQKRKDAAAKKKKDEAEAKAKAEAEAEAEEAEAPELAKTVTKKDLFAAAKTWLSASDEEDVRDGRKAEFKGALQHLGYAALPEVTDESDLAKLAGYVAYWTAGIEFKFADVDALIEDEDLGV